jgi:hypothetical protein
VENWEKNDFKINADQRIHGLAEIDALVSAIESGNWAYSISKLKSDFQGYKFHTWTELHLVLTCIFVVVGFILYLFPAIGLIISINIAKAGRERYEQHLIQLKNGGVISAIVWS